MFLIVEAGLKNKAHQEKPLINRTSKDQEEAVVPAPTSRGEEVAAILQKQEIDHNMRGRPLGVIPINTLPRTIRALNKHMHMLLTLSMSKGPSRNKVLMDILSLIITNNKQTTNITKMPVAKDTVRLSDQTEAIREGAVVAAVATITISSHEKR